MTHTIKQNVSTTLSLAAYGLAAGTLGAISLPAGAAEQTMQGLPITIGGSQPSVEQDGGALPFVDLDINGDVVADVRVQVITAYGGGFAINALNVGDSGNRIQARFIRSDRTLYYKGYVTRNDSAEVISEEGYYHSIYGDFEDTFIYLEGNANINDTYNMLLIDANGSSSYLPYTPFRSKPGFISLVLSADSGTAGVSPLAPHIAWLEVVVSPDGSLLSILRSDWQANDNDDYIVLPAVSPPETTTVAPGLAGLALGSK